LKGQESLFRSFWTFSFSLLSPAAPAALSSCSCCSCCSCCSSCSFLFFPLLSFPLLSLLSFLFLLLHPLSFSQSLAQFPPYGFLCNRNMQDAELRKTLAATSGDQKEKVNQLRQILTQVLATPPASVPLLIKVYLEYGLSIPLLFPREMIVGSISTLFSSCSASGFPWFGDLQADCE